jgi:hypothetical protein
MALADSLHGLLRLPGATYSCVVERDTGRVLAEVGQGEGGAGDGEGVVPYSVARWGTAVAAMFDTTSGDDLDDVMITGRRSYHLVRPLGPTASVLVYLRLDRARSNLAAARRELAAVRWGSGAAGATRAAGPAAGPPASTPVPPPRGGVEPARPVPAPAEAGSRRTPAPPQAHRAVAEARTARSAGEARTIRATRIPAALPPTGTPARGVPAAGTDGPRPARPAKPVDPQRLPRIPLPRRAPAVRTSEPASRRRPADGAETVAPEGFVVPPVLGQSWARDPSTLRRLIAGLRRMS